MLKKLKLKLLKNRQNPSHRIKKNGNGNGRTLSTQSSVNSAIKSICDVMRRSNCAGALQYVPELTWLLTCVTAKGQMKDLFELSSNIFAFVEKPFEPKNLVKIVKDAIASKK